MGSGEKLIQCEPRIIEDVSVGEEGSGKQHISTSFDAALFSFSSSTSFVENSHDYGLLEMAPECKEIVLIVGDEEGTEEVEKTALLDNNTPLTSSFSSPSSSPSCAVNEGVNLALHKGVGKVVLAVDKTVEENPKRKNPPTVPQPYRFCRMEESAVFEDSSSNVLSSTSCPLSSSPSTFSLPLSRALFPSSPLAHPTTSATTVTTTPSKPSSHHNVLIPSTLFSASHKAVRYCDPWKGEKEDTDGAFTPCGVCVPSPFSSTPLRPRDFPLTTSPPSSSVSCVVPPVCALRSSLRYGWCGAPAHLTAHRPSSPSPSSSRGKESGKGHSLRLSLSVPALSSFRSSGAPVKRSTPSTTLSSSGDGSGRDMSRDACRDTLPLDAAWIEDHTHATHGTADEKETRREGKQRRLFSVSLPPSSSPSFGPQTNGHRDNVHCLAPVPLSHRIRGSAVGGSTRMGKESPSSSPRVPSPSDASNETVAGTPKAPVPFTTESMRANKAEQEVCEGLAQVEIAPGRVILIPLLHGDHLPSLAAAFLLEHGLSPTLQVVVENFLVGERRRWRRQRSAAAPFSSPTFLLGSEENANGMGRNLTRATSRSGSVCKEHHPEDGGKDSVVHHKRKKNAASARREKSPIVHYNAGEPPPRAMASGLRSPSVLIWTEEREERSHKKKTRLAHVLLSRPTRTTVLRQQYWRQQLEHEGELHRPDEPKRVSFSPRQSREGRSGRPLFSVDVSRLSLPVLPGMETTEREGAASVPSLPFSSRLLSDDKKEEKRVEKTSSSQTWAADMLPPSDSAAASPVERVFFAFPAALASRHEISGTETVGGEEEKENRKRKPVAPYLPRGSGIPKDIRSTEEIELQEKCTFHPKINRYGVARGRVGPSSVAREDGSRRPGEDPPRWEKSGREEWRNQMTARHASFSPPRGNSDQGRACGNAARRESGQSSTKRDSSASAKDDRSGRLPPALSDIYDHPQSRSIAIPVQNSPAFPTSCAFAPSSSCQTTEGVRYDGRDVPSPFSFCCTTRFPRHFPAVPLTHPPSVSDAPQKHATAERSTTMLSHRSSGQRSTGKENGVHFKDVDLMKRVDGTNPAVNSALPSSSARASSSMRNGRERSSGIPAISSTIASSSSSRYCFSSAKTNPILSTSSPTLASAAEIKEKLASLSHQWKKREDFLCLMGSK